MSDVRREIVLPLPRPEAWELVTEGAWLADEVELEAEEGGLVRAAWADGEQRIGVVEVVEPEEHVRFRWMGAEGASEVEWRLEDDEGGTRLVVVERRLMPVAAPQGPQALCLA